MAADPLISAVLRALRSGSTGPCQGAQHAPSHSRHVEAWREGGCGAAERQQHIGPDTVQRMCLHATDRHAAVEAPQRRPQARGEALR